MLNWKGETAVVIASGPSLNRADCFDVSQAAVRVIAVNCSFRMAPWTDVVYMGDMLAIKTYSGEMRKLCAKRTQFWTTMPERPDMAGWKSMKGSNDVGLGKNAVFLNGNSGFQSINLAYLFGAKRILLLGFDMQLGHNGAKHFHPDHPRPMVQWQPFSEWIYKSEKLARDCREANVEVINCSRATALTAFPRGDLLEELKCRQPG